jgi:hypothetical protein
LVMVSLIITFPALISVGTKTDMKEQIELNIDMSGDSLDDLTNAEFSFDGDTGSGDIKLDMAAEPAK